MVAESVEIYCAAWCEPNREKRLALLEQCWTDEGSYQDPSAEVRGRDALCDHIGALHLKMPGARIELTSAIRSHHGNICFGWQLVAPDGAVAVKGIDFGVVAPDGRIEQIVGFFEPPARENEGEHP